MEEEKDDILSNFKKTERPVVPSDYFDSFQKKMLDQVTPEEKKKKPAPVKEMNTGEEKPPMEFNMKYLYYTIGVAAAVALVFFAVKNIDFSGSKKQEAPVVEEKQEETVDSSVYYYEYVEENLAEFSSEEIIELLADNEEVFEEEVNISNVPTSEVETYILEEYEELEEELLDEL